MGPWCNCLLWSEGWFSLVCQKMGFLPVSRAFIQYGKELFTCDAVNKDCSLPFEHQACKTAPMAETERVFAIKNMLSQIVYLTEKYFKTYRNYACDQKRRKCYYIECRFAKVDHEKQKHTIIWFTKRSLTCCFACHQIARALAWLCASFHLQSNKSICMEIWCTRHSDIREDIWELY